MKKVDKYYFWHKQNEKPLSGQGAEVHVGDSKKDHYCQFIMEGKLTTSVITGSFYYYIETKAYDRSKKEWIVGKEKRKSYYIVGLGHSVDARDIIVLGRNVDAFTKLKAENFRLCSKLYRVKEVARNLEGLQKSSRRSLINSMKSIFNNVKDDLTFGLLSNSAPDREMAKLLIEYNKEKENVETTK